jgi:hypothetical protein
MTGTEIESKEAENREKINKERRKMRKERAIHTYIL